MNDVVSPTVALDQPVLNFKVNATSEKDIMLSACKGYNVVLYFYPRDNTPGFTTEGQDFRDLYDQFKAKKTCVFGVSQDSLASHEKFKAKYDFPFELISDSDGQLCEQFDVIKQKNMYGRQFTGIERSTFLIDGQGVLRQAWRKVKVSGHAQAVLDAIDEL